MLWLVVSFLLGVVCAVVLIRALPSRSSRMLTFKNEMLEQENKHVWGLLDGYRLDWLKLKFPEQDIEAKVELKHETTH